MAGLNLPSLMIDILADGSSAIKEIKETAKSVDVLTEAVKKAEITDAKYHKNSTGRWVDSNGKFVKASQVAEELGDQFEEFERQANEAAKAVQSFGDITEVSTSKTAKDIKKIAEGMDSIGTSLSKKVSLPIVAALGAAVSAASDFTETMGKTDVVFGELTDSVIKWSESSIEAMGMAQGTALDMASAYGDMATGMGLAQGQAAQMSMSMVQLAADIASFKNKSLGDVNSALTGIFTGETEALKGLGIVMTQTNLQNYAFTQGITKQISAMTQAEQVQLRYSYVMAQTKNAQGDFLRTGDSLANQSRKLNETIKQLGESFGQLLTERVAEVVGGLQQAVQFLMELDDGAKDTILTIGLIVAAAGPLLMVGGKVISMITALKTQMALLAANPVGLIVGGSIAGIAALVAAVNSADESLDKTSKTYSRVKSAIEGGASGEITVDASQVENLADNPPKLTVDTSQIDALEENPPQITINADGQNALDEAQEIASALNSGKYDGELAIDGDPKAAEQALEELEAAIEAAEAAMTIDANGDAVLGAGGELERLQAAIRNIEGIVAITEDPATKAELQARLDALKAQLSTFNASVTFNEDKETKANIEAFKKSLEGLPKDEIYSATGEFKVSETTTETIKQYAEALAAAATATGDYQEAVENLNNIIDVETQRKIGEVNAQLAAEGRNLTALLNDGLISSEEYDARIAAENERAYQQRKAIEAEAEAQKELNKVYADGLRSNDPVALGSAFREIYKNEHISEAQKADAGRKLVDTYESGGDMSQNQLEGMITLNALRDQAIEKQNQLNEAVNQYNASMAQADADETAAIEKSQKKIAEAEILWKALDQYVTASGTGGTSPQDAADQVIENMSAELEAYEGLEERLRGILQGEDGTGLSTIDAMGAMAAIPESVATAESEITAATEAAITARETALADFTAKLNEIRQGFTEAEVSAALDLASQTGAAVSDLDRQVIEGGSAVISNLAQTIESGTSDISGAINSAQSAMNSAVGTINGSLAIMKEHASQGGSAAVSGMAQAIESGTGEVRSAATSAAGSVKDAKSTGEREGKAIGSAVTSGVAAGIRAGTGEAIRAAVASAAAVAAAYARRLEIRSPSRVMRRMGPEIPRGLALGVKDAMPEALAMIRESVSQIKSSATAVIDNGAYTIPAQAIPASAGIAIDYDKLGDVISSRPVNLSIGSEQLAEATRNDVARQQAVRVQQINSGYGSKGGN